MGNLSAFLAENAIKVENVKYAASKRFVDEKGKPMEWEIQSITAQEDEKIRKAYTRKVQVPGKKTQYTQEFDSNAYVAKLCTVCTVFPNLNDAELQNSYGVMCAEDLLRTMLTAGEYTDYQLQIQQINGFDVTIGDDVEEAKN